MTGRGSRSQDAELFGGILLLSLSALLLAWWAIGLIAALLAVPVLIVSNALQHATLTLWESRPGRKGETSGRTSDSPTA